MTEAEAERALSDLLVAAGYSPCSKCGRQIDRGDVAWNNPSTEAGTDYTVVEIQCQGCNSEIVRFTSWWPGADNFEDLVENVFQDMPKRDEATE